MTGEPVLNGVEGGKGKGTGEGKGPPGKAATLAKRWVKLLVRGP